MLPWAVVFRVLVQELLFGDKNEPGADVAVAKVATLSEHAFEAPRKESDLNPVLTAGVTRYTFAPLASSPVISSGQVSTSSRPDGASHPLSDPKEKQAGMTILPKAKASSPVTSSGPVSTSSTLDGAPHPLNGPKEKQAGMTILPKAKITEADTLLKKASLRVEKSRDTSSITLENYNMAKGLLA